MTEWHHSVTFPDLLLIPTLNFFNENVQSTEENYSKILLRKNKKIIINENQITPLPYVDTD